MTPKRAKVLRKDLNKNKLYNYLVIHNMTVGQLCKMYNVSRTIIDSIIREQNFDFRSERERYKMELHERMMESDKVTRCTYKGNNALKLA
jgi:hypothetical protein